MMDGGLTFPPGLVHCQASVCTAAILSPLTNLEVLSFRGFIGFREFVEAGGLISYGINLVANWDRIVALVDKILKGEQVANIPVEFIVLMSGAAVCRRNG
jgi:hypothetical protein